MKCLYEVYKDYFPIGTAVSLEKIDHYKDLLPSFNSITLENELKFCEIHPEEKLYDFSNSDKLVQYAISNNKLVRGHTIVWHNQNPNWLFEGKEISRNVLLKRMQEHICTILDRYRNSIYCWDVVNEVFSDGGQVLRNTKWKEIIGEDYIEKAFFYAHDASPKAQLFLNEYNCEIKEKQERVIEYIKYLKKKNVPIDGIGIQGHFGIFFPNIGMIRKMFEEFAKLNLQIQITELDVSLFRFEDETCDIKKPSEDMLDVQARYYGDLFSVFREFKDVISGVTFWGIADDFTWLDDYPVVGRKNWPLLFDEKLQPKKAFDAIINF